MSRTLHWNDYYCPNGHHWVFGAASSLYPDFYWCPIEDKFWEPTVKPLKPEKVAKQYHGHRLDEMRRYAQKEKALEEISYLRSFDEIIAFAAPTTNKEKDDE